MDALGCRMMVDFLAATHANADFVFDSTTLHATLVTFQAASTYRMWYYLSDRWFYEMQQQWIPTYSSKNVNELSIAHEIINTNNSSWLKTLTLLLQSKYLNQEYHHLMIACMALSSKLFEMELKPVQLLYAGFPSLRLPMIGSGITFLPESRQFDHWSKRHVKQPFHTSSIPPNFFNSQSLHSRQHSSVVAVSSYTSSKPSLSFFYNKDQVERLNVRLQSCAHHWKDNQTAVDDYRWFSDDEADFFSNPSTYIDHREINENDPSSTNDRLNIDDDSNMPSPSTGELPADSSSSTPSSSLSPFEFLCKWHRLSYPYYFWDHTTSHVVTPSVHVLNTRIQGEILQSLHGLLPQASFAAWIASPVWSHIFKKEQLAQLELLFLCSYVIPYLNAQRQQGYSRHLVWAIAWLLFLVQYNVIQLSKTPVYNLNKFLPDSGNMLEYLDVMMYEFVEARDDPHDSSSSSTSAPSSTIIPPKLKQLRALIPMVDQAILQQIDLTACMPVKAMWSYDQVPPHAEHVDIPCLSVWLSRLEFPTSMCTHHDLQTIHRLMHHCWTLAARFSRSPTTQHFFTHLRVSTM